MDDVVRKHTCPDCGSRGFIRATPNAYSENGYDLEIRVKHKRGCKYRPKQPEHFKNKRKWQRGEERGNALIGAKETKASGALNKDGDGRVLNEWRVETKTTKNDSYRLTKELWNKLAEGAISCGEEPIFYVETSFISFVIFRDIINHSDKKQLSTANKSVLLSKALALELNKEEHRSGQILEGWKHNPCVILKNNFNKEQIYETKNH